MTASGDDRNPVEALAESFLERYRRGERPALSEYTRQHPDLADQIRNVFPTLIVLESLGPHSESSDPAADGDSADAAPTHLGEYRIVREIGRGGMGIVYEAEQRSLDRRVALKVLPLHASMSPSHLRRFKSEARAAARLHHSNIVPVFAVGEQEGVHFYAMQFIDGRGFDEVLRELRRRSRIVADETGRSSPLPSTRFGGGTRTRATQARSSDKGSSDKGSSDKGSSDKGSSDKDSVRDSSASVSGRANRAATAGAEASTSPKRGLAAAGDPTAADGDAPSDESAVRWKGDRGDYFRSVAQLGIQVAEGLAYAHQQGVVHRDVKPSNLLIDDAGTAWIADFGLAKHCDDNLTTTGQLLGTLRYMAPEQFRGVAGAAGDIHGLGLTLYEMLTLRPAFEAPDRARLMQQIVHSVPVRPRSINDRIPRDLETIVLKAIEKQPRHRYASATELADDLRRYLEDKPILARRASVPARAWRWCRRNPAIAALSATVATLLLALAMGSTLVALQTRRHSAQMARERNVANRNLFHSLREQARAVRRTMRPGKRAQGLTAAREAATLQESLDLPEEEIVTLRNEAIACLALTDVRLVRGWDVHRVYEVAFDSELERHTDADGDGALTVYRAADGRELVRFTETRAATTRCPMFSPDDRLLVLRDGDSLCHLWRLDPLMQLLEKMPVNRNALDFDADSRLLAVGQTDGTIRVHDLENVDSPPRVLPRGPVPAVLRFRPDGRAIALASPDYPGVHVRDATTGELVDHYDTSGGVFDIDWSRDGSMLTAACSDFNVHVWDVAAGTKRILHGPKTEMVRVGFNERGNLLASSSWDGYTQIWDPISGKQHVRLRGSFRRFDRDGRRMVLTKDGRAECWEVLHDTVAATFYGHFGHKSPNNCALDRHSRLMATSGHDGVRLWDVAASRELALLPVGECRSVLFDDESGDLITTSKHGLLRWPVERRFRRDEVRVGPPRRLAHSFQPAVSLRATRIPTERSLAFMSSPGHMEILSLDDPRRRRTLDCRDTVDKLEFGPRAGQLVTFGQQGFNVRDPRDGRVIRNLGQGTTHDHAQFSPDGRLLVTGTPSEYRIWDTDSWEVRFRLPRSDRVGCFIAFSPDGGTLAVCPSVYTIQLMDLATCRELARLESSDPQVISRIRFSPDGRRLAEASSGHRIRLWNLIGIRSRLADMHLDWAIGTHERPRIERPTAGQRDEHSTVKPLKVTVDTGDLLDLESASELWERASIAWTRGDFGQAIRRYERLARLTDRHPFACNELAWAYVTGPAELRDPERAFELADRAARAAPRVSSYRNTRAVANYRLDNLDAAIMELNETLESSRVKAIDWYFLAMAYHKSGDPRKARSSYDKAEAWRATRSSMHPYWIEELDRYRAEAMSVLGIGAVTSGTATRSRP